MPISDMTDDRTGRGRERAQQRRWMGICICDNGKIPTDSDSVAGRQPPLDLGAFFSFFSIFGACGARCKRAPKQNFRLGRRARKGDVSLCARMSSELGTLHFRTCVNFCNRTRTRTKMMFLQQDTYKPSWWTVPR